MHDCSGAAEGHELKSSTNIHGHINDDIETLRAIAILSVLFHHFGYLVVGQAIFTKYSATFGLWSGVDLFLCISGFIIAKGYYFQFSHAPRGKLLPLAISFWMRRFFRLAPSAWLWLALAVLVFTMAGLSPLRNNLSDALAAFFGFANLHWWNCLNERGACGSIGNYWSLSLEEQFYWLFPAIFLLPRKLHLWVVLAIAAVQIPIPRAHWTSQFLPFFRTDALALGIAVYLLSQTTFHAKLKLGFMNNKVLGMVVLALLLVAFAACSTPQAHPEKAIIPFATGLVAIVSASFVFVASYNQDWILNFRLVRPALLWVGGRSYALYLIQAVAFYAVMPLFELDAVKASLSSFWLAVLTCIGVFGLMGLFAEMNYRFVEVPLRTRGANIARGYLQRRMGGEQTKKPQPKQGSECTASCALFDDDGHAVRFGHEVDTALHLKA